MSLTAVPAAELPYHRYVFDTPGYLNICGIMWCANEVCCLKPTSLLSIHRLFANGMVNFHDPVVAGRDYSAHVFRV